tara:strand:- start:166 stop:429 length:264 start_codon:yes stop_codon:yes gene_type:complete
MIMSKHALIRSQQRGIDTKTISVILKYGHSEYTRDGAKMWRLNEKEKRFAKSDLGNEFIKIEKKLGFVIIKAGLIITVAHQTRRFYN